MPENRKKADYEFAKANIKKYRKGSETYEALKYIIDAEEKKLSTFQRTAGGEFFNRPNAERVVDALKSGDRKNAHVLNAERDTIKSEDQKVKPGDPPIRKTEEGTGAKNLDAAARKYLELYKEGKVSDILDVKEKLKKERQWNDQQVEEFANKVKDLVDKEGVAATETPVKKAPTKSATVSGSSNLSKSIAGKGDTTIPAPRIDVKGVTAQPETQQPPQVQKEPDPVGNLGGLADKAGATSANEAKTGFKWGVGEALGAGQVGLGLVGADKYSKLSESLIRNYPADTIPIESQIAYGDSQIAKNTMLLRSKQGLDAAQKAEIEAKIEGTAAADLSTATNPLSRTLGVRAKYDAILGLASADEQVRSNNEQKYLAALEGANQEGARMSQIKRQLYEDRRNKWEQQYQRALMGEQAGAQLLTAGISNIAMGIQMKEIEAMKKPNVTYNLPG